MEWGSRKGPEVSFLFCVLSTCWHNCVCFYKGDQNRNLFSAPFFVEFPDFWSSSNFTDTDTNDHELSNEHNQALKHVGVDHSLYSWNQLRRGFNMFLRKHVHGTTKKSENRLEIASKSQVRTKRTEAKVQPSCGFCSVLWCFVFKLTNAACNESTCVQRVRSLMYMYLLLQCRWFQQKHRWGS